MKYTIEERKMNKLLLLVNTIVLDSDKPVNKTILKKLKKFLIEFIQDLEYQERFS